MVVGVPHGPAADVAPAIFLLRAVDVPAVTVWPWLELVEFLGLYRYRRQMALVLTVEKNKGRKPGRQPCMQMIPRRARTVTHTRTHVHTHVSIFQCLFHSILW